MPFNETNDYTAQWHEKTWHLTDKQQSPFPVSGLLQSRQHFWQHWQTRVRSGSQCWGSLNAKTPELQVSLWGQGVTVLGSHLWACSEQCFPQALGERGRKETWECGLTEMCIACEVLVAAMSQKNFIIKMEFFFLLGALLSPIHCVLLLLWYIFAFFVSFLM